MIKPASAPAAGGTLGNLILMKNDAVILIIDDEKEHANALVEALEKNCAKAIAVYNADDARRIIENEKFDLVITDLDLRADINGIDILDLVRANNPALPVILITAYATIETCKDAIRRGAYDYLTKPIDIDQLRAMVTKALAPGKRKYAAKEDFAFDGIIGTSSWMRSVFHVLQDSFRSPGATPTLMKLPHRAEGAPVGTAPRGFHKVGVLPKVEVVVGTILVD